MIDKIPRGSSDLMGIDMPLFFISTKLIGIKSLKFKLPFFINSGSPNIIGVYDMLGNVWEMASDYFYVNHNKNLSSNNLMNPKGASKTFNPNNPYEVQRIIKGGLFLCNASYCASYRISAKIPMTLDSESDHIGFRTIATVDI